MRQLNLSGAELQSLVAAALTNKLRKSGFRFGTPSNDHSAFWLPVRIGLSGAVEVENYEDGSWSFKQYDSIVEYERTKFTEAAHVDAAMSRESPVCP